MPCPRAPEGFRSHEDWLADKEGTTKGEAKKTTATAKRLHGGGSTSPPPGTPTGSAGSPGPQTPAPDSGSGLLFDLTPEPCAEPSANDPQSDLAETNRPETDPTEQDLAPADPAAGDAGSQPDAAQPDSTGLDDQAAEPGKCACGNAPVPAPGRELIYLIDLAAARRGRVLSGEVCEIAGVGPVPVEIANDWADDPFIKAVILDGTDIHKVAHYGRNMPAHLQTALQVRDALNVFVCDVCGRSSLRLEQDHIVPHAAGGQLSFTNNSPKCRRCHQAKTNQDRKNGLTHSGSRTDQPTEPSHDPP